MRLLSFLSVEPGLAQALGRHKGTAALCDGVWRVEGWALEQRPEQGEPGLSSREVACAKARSGKAWPTEAVSRLLGLCQELGTQEWQAGVGELVGGIQ